MRPNSVGMFQTFVGRSDLRVTVSHNGLSRSTNSIGDLSGDPFNLGGDSIFILQSVGSYYDMGTGDLFEVVGHPNNEIDAEDD